MGMRCPRAWPRKPCPGRPVEKAPKPTKGLRMKSVASAREGQGVITLAGRRGRGPHRINTAVERRKARPVFAGPVRLLARAATLKCAFTALRSLFWGSANRKGKQKLGRDF